MQFFNIFSSTVTAVPDALAMPGGARPLQRGAGELAALEAPAAKRYEVGAVRLSGLTV